MTVHTPHLRIGALAMLALSATLLGLPVRAAGKAAPQGAHAFYMHQRALCATQRPADERDDCLSEASTAYAATQPSLPGDDADSLLRNKLRRCEPLRGADQLDCTGTSSTAKIWRSMKASADSSASIARLTRARGGGTGDGLDMVRAAATGWLGHGTAAAKPHRAARAAIVCAQGANPHRPRGRCHWPAAA